MNIYDYDQCDACNNCNQRLNDTCSSDCLIFKTNICKTCQNYYNCNIPIKKSEKLPCTLEQVIEVYIKSHVSWYNFSIENKTKVRNLCCDHCQRKCWLGHTSLYIY